MRRAQPLKIDVGVRRVEIIARGCLWKRMPRMRQQIRGGRFQSRQAAAIQSAQPTIRIPTHLLDDRLAHPSVHRPRLA